MIATTAKEFLDAYGDGSRFPPRRTPCLRAALLVGPHGFAVSDESREDNRYMAVDGVVDRERAHDQHRALVAKLGELGVPVVIFPAVEGQDDGVFPNNVFATVPGRLIVGSMRHPGRRREAERDDIRSLFRDTFRYEVCDLSGRGFVAELTGPLVIDRPRGVGFCGLSGRADEAGCAAMHEAFDLGLTLRFSLVEGEYHANIVLAVLAGRFCILHRPSFADGEVADAIAKTYSGCTLLLSDEEKAAFAGNSIAVTERDVLFSETSRGALRPTSVRALEGAGWRIHVVQVDEMEKAGGSLRCLIAEVF